MRFKKKKKKKAGLKVEIWGWMRARAVCKAPYENWIWACCSVTPFRLLPVLSNFFFYLIHPERRRSPKPHRFIANSFYDNGWQKKRKRKSEKKQYLHTNVLIQLWGLKKIDTRILLFYYVCEMRIIFLLSRHTLCFISPHLLPSCSLNRLVAMRE